MSTPRSEYPRPHMRRSEDSRMCLNGTWEFETDRENTGIRRCLWNEKKLSGVITVPFVMESRLSGIGTDDFSDCVWYARDFILPKSFDCSTGRVLFHIGAADYECSVWINGSNAGGHRGGYTPVCLDITEYVKGGENRAVIRVFDDVTDPLQPSGKQSARQEAYGCFYTRCTGIWQSVWIEYVPRKYVVNTKIIPNVENEAADITVMTEGDGKVICDIYYGEKKVSSACGNTYGGKAEMTVKIEDPELWDVGRGKLYEARIAFEEDLVICPFGMRSVKVEGNKVLLNGKPLFQRLVLDQGYYPDGIYTPESADEFRRDIAMCMAAGFNGARMHMKIFDPLYIYEADKAGFLLWGEYPNWGLDISRKEADGAMLPEWREALERDVNHPSIIGWCPFNETIPGDNKAIIESAVSMAKKYDPSRPVIDSSGWTHAGCTDIYDVHDYEQDPDVFASHYSTLKGDKPFYNEFEGAAPYDGKLPYFVSEFGGAFFDTDAVCRNAGEEGANTWESENPWGYGEAPADAEAFVDRLAKLCAVLRDDPDICGFCYTQFTDVMQEMNGIFTFDRREKFPMDDIRRAVAGE